jgi:Prenyltransferase and squalene oxidase repeat
VDRRSAGASVGSDPLTALRSVTGVFGRRRERGVRPRRTPAPRTSEKRSAAVGACAGVLALVLIGLASAASVPSPAAFVTARQQPDGGFAEPGARSDPALTAWAVLGLKASGRSPARSAATYLRETPAEDTTDLALRVLALRALGESPAPLLDRLQRQRRRDGRVGALVNSTIWSVLALPRGERPAVRYLLRQQRRSGGWSWAPNGAPDSNDTAAAIQALRWNGVRGRPIRRGLAYIRRLTAPNGGVRLTTGREPDAQSTAWAIQAYVAAGVRPPAATFRFLASLRRADGSYRYTRRYAVTPAIVTAQVLPALSRKPFPLR